MTRHARRPTEATRSGSRRPSLSNPLVAVLAALLVIAVGCSSDSAPRTPLDGPDADRPDEFGSMYWDGVTTDGTGFSNLPPISPPPKVTDAVVAQPTPIPEPTATAIPTIVTSPPGGPTPTPVVAIAQDPYDDGPGAFFPVPAAGNSTPRSVVADDRVFSCEIDGEHETLAGVEASLASGGGGVAVTGVNLAASTIPSGGSLYQQQFLATPDTRVIDLDFDPVNDRVTVVGLAGSVPPLSNVLVGNIQLNDFTALIADETGAFATDVAAVQGTHVLIKQDTTGNFIRPDAQLDENLIAPGVLIQIPVEPVSDGVAFAAGAKPCCDAEATAPFTIDGVIESDRIEPGGSARIAGTVKIFGDPNTRPADELFQVQMTLLGDSQGRQVGRAGKFVSPFLTPTGLPIERSLGSIPIGRFIVGEQEIEFDFDGRYWVADFDLSIEVPDWVRAGTYALVSENLWNLTDAAIPAAEELRPIGITPRDSNQYRPALTTIVVGEPNPMRLTATILADQVDDGARGGLVSREDFKLFNIAGRSATRHDPVIQRLDPYGDPWSYHLDPFVPMLDVADRAIPGAPSLNPDLTDSSLKITIERPDGEIDVIGPAPLTRYGVKSPRTDWGQPLGVGGGELREIPQLMGDGDTFAYKFPVDGDYTVTLNGRVPDTNGNVHGICGTYDVTVAEHLEIETSILPTTPFEVGDSIAPTVTIQPGVPADVSYSITLVGADSEVDRFIFRGTANSFGWWDGDDRTFKFSKDGEYRIDIDTRFTAPDGRIWVGRTTFGGVVATPDAPIIARGRRGPDNQEELAKPWAFEESFDAADGDHWQFPYFTGDVLWGDTEPGPGQALITRLSIQSTDDDHPLVARALDVTEKFGTTEDLPLDVAIRASQIPLTLGPEDSGLPGSHPDELSLWSYVYGSAQRPGVRVREMIQGDDINGAYWRFDDAYHGQLGNGPAGDLPGEYKFLYGGAVIRDPIKGEGIYAIYGSSWVHIVDDDPLGSRVFPPFQGSVGGPDGGPLFETHGREVDIFMIPMAVRPGAVLEVGDRFRMSGPVMPTLPSLVEYTVIAPDGTRRDFSGRANAIGHFYNPKHDFVLDQPGEWTVEVTVIHDGQTSAGPVQPPYPSGGVLSPDGRTFRFVVVEPETHVAEWSTDLQELTPEEWFADRSEATFTTELPVGWSSDKARLIVSMPGNVLIDEEIVVADGKVEWSLDGDRLNQIASNFDTGGGLYDTLTITLSATGEIDGSTAFGVASMVTHGARVPETPPTAGG